MFNNKLNSLSNYLQKQRKKITVGLKSFTDESFQISDKRNNILSDIKGKLNQFYINYFRKYRRKNFQTCFMKPEQPGFDKTLKNQT